MFFGGFILIVMGWFLFTTVGFVLQIYGLFLLFRQFLMTIFSFLKTLPVIGPILSSSPMIHNLVERIAGNSSNSSAGKKFEV